MICLVRSEGPRRGRDIGLHMALPAGIPRPQEITIYSNKGSNMEMVAGLIAALAVSLYVVTDMFLMRKWDRWQNGIRITD